MHKHEHPTARKVVANLAYHYRGSLRIERAAEKRGASKKDRRYHRGRTEQAWLSYLMSKRILLGLAP